MSDNLISRSALIETINKISFYSVHNGEFIEGAGLKDVAYYRERDIYGAIIDAPTVERPKGKWKLVEHGKDIDLECPFCGYQRGNLSYGYTMEEVLKDIAEDDTMLTKFCEMCGADLRGGV